MSTYVIVLQERDDSVWGIVKEEWPHRHFIWNDYAAFVAPPGITTSLEIAETLGFNPTGDRRGIVSELTPAHRGYVKMALVEWIKNAEKEPPT